MMITPGATQPWGLAFTYYLPQRVKFMPVPLDGTRWRPVVLHFPPWPKYP